MSFLNLSEFIFWFRFFFSNQNETHPHVVIPLPQNRVLISPSITPFQHTSAASSFPRFAPSLGGCYLIEGMMKVADWLADSPSSSLC
ncbi:hypothetical protein AKJ16_DCAP18336 [Drosera capensis]